MTNRDFISEVERIISEHNRPPSMNRRSRHGDLQGERRRIEAITGDERLWLYACKQAVQQQKDSWLNEIVSTENSHWMLRFLSNEQRSRLENNIDAPIAQAIAGSALAAFHMLTIADDQSLLDEVLYQLYQATSRWQQVHRPDLQNPITSSTDILSTLRDELDAEQTPLLLLQNIVASFHKHLPNWHIGPIRDLIHFFWESDEPAMQSETVIQTEEVQVAVLIHLDDTTGLVAILELEAIPSGTEHLYPDPRFMAFFKPDLSFRQALETAWKYARLQSWYREHHDVRWRMFALTTPQHRFRQVQQANGGSIGAGCALALLYLFDTQRQSKNMASWAITGGVNENGLITSVTGYASKLDAARQQNRKVVFPADDRERVRHLIDTDPSLESLERYPVLSIEAAAETIATDTPFVPSLDWPELCNRGQIISEKFILQITTRQSYEEQNRVISIPYLQRARVYQSFQRFLTSDKRCFVLIGKSGMGKSSFLLSMGKNLLSRTDICVLMYDAQQIYGNLDAVIAADVIGLDTQDSEDDSRISDFWQYIQQKVGLDKRAILFIDAINEHSQAQHLLRQVDKLVRKPWPWLKIVISSRPETWKVIRQPVSLDEQNYYRETSTDPTITTAKV
jgi:hypothetical protein